MSDTPRTDDFIGDQTGIYLTPGEETMCNFARKLERELTAVTAERDEAEKRSADWEWLYHKFGELSNERTAERDAARESAKAWEQVATAFKEQAHDEVNRLTEQLATAKAALEMCIEEHENVKGYLSHRYQDGESVKGWLDDTITIITKAREALAKSNDTQIAAFFP